MEYFVILLFTNLLIYCHAGGVQNSCLTQNDLQADCTSIFDEWLYGDDFWNGICNVTGEGEAVFDCMVHHRYNCEGGLYDLEMIFDAMFSPFSFNLRATCDYHLVPECETVSDCYNNVTNFIGDGVYNFYNFFCGEYNFPGLFACLDNLRLSCPDLVALNENKFTIRSSNSARVINQPEIRTLTSTQCINLLDSDITCIQTRQADFGQCSISLDIDVPSQRLSCGISDTMTTCITELCGSTVADFFTYMFSYIQCYQAEINECTNGMSQCDVNADCTDTDGSYLCQCKTGYKGNGFTCVDVNECKDVNECDTNANCINYDGSYLCQCKNGYIGSGLTCTVDNTWGAWTEWNQCTVSCNGGKRTRTRICYSSDVADTQTTCVGDDSETQDCSLNACPVTTCSAVILEDITWPLTDVGRHVTFKCPSSYQTGEIRRQCSFGGEWGDVENECTVNEEGLQEIEQTIDDVLGSSSGTTDTASVLTTVTGDLEDLTEDDENFDDNINVIKSIVDIADSVNDAVNKTDTVTDEISDNVVGALSNILDPKYEDEWQEQDDVKGSDIIETLDEHLSLVTELKCNELNDNDIIDINKANVYTEIGKTTQAITFPNTDQREGSDVTILRETLTNLGLSTICFNGAYYNSPLEFVQKDLSVNGTVESFDGKRLINSNIISIQLDTGVKVSNLSPPVTVKLAIKDTTFTDPACVFLDFNITGDDERVAWSTEGCELTSYKGTHVTCSCNHLTNFAILMSPSGVSESHTRTLGIISAVGCAISMICLLLTIILHCIVWRLVRSDRAIILMNLCVALLIALGIFLAGVNRTESRIACIIVAALIQFFFLAVFFFMLLIGIEILICVVHVFMTKFRIKILLPLAWVFPALIVGISLGVSTDGYGNDRFCWLDTGTGLIWAFIGPVAFIILINLIVIVIVFKKMASSHAVKSKSTSIKVKTGIRSVCVLVPVMGLTWVFGILSVNQDLVIFQYIFCIFNTLQGLCIFLFHCVFNRQIRDALKHRSARKRSLQTFSSDFRKQTNSGACVNRKEANSRRPLEDSYRADSRMDSSEDWDRQERKQYQRDIRRTTLT